MAGAVTNIVPGAIWSPVDVGNRAARRTGRGLIGHVAVSNSVKLIPGPLASRPADWHFYLPKEPQPQGRFFQLIDLDVQCWSSAAGNATCPAFESQGGMGTTAQVNAEPWTDNQVESAAIILAYLHDTEGVPLQDMGNSLPGSRGLGVHRYGIDPWRVSGGEVWSSSRGKICPGDAKVAQVPQIVARAQQLTTGGFLMALTDAQQAQLASDVQNTIDQLMGPGWRAGGGAGGWPTERWAGDQEKLTAIDYLRRIDRQLNSVLTLANRPTDPATGDNEFGQVLSLRADVAALAEKVSTAGGQVDAVALAAALAANDGFITRLADALVKRTPA